MTKTKVLIDMDIGDDIDDALALYLAMRLDYDIVGVTTVFGDTEKRARIAKKMLRLYGGKYSAVPVYAGAGNAPAELSKHATYLCQYTPELNDEQYAPDGVGNAAAFILDCCQKYGKELAILAIGPFTNIAEVIQTDSTALNTIGKFIIMGGAYFKQYADWNVMCDIASAAIMFDHVSILECLGADVTHKLPISTEDSAKLLSCFRDDAAKYLARLYRAWLDASGKKSAVLHDPLAVYYLSHPEICTVKDASVIVIPDGPAAGMTLNVDAYGKAGMNSAYQNFDKTNKVKVASDVDSEKFVNTFMSLF